MAIPHPDLDEKSQLAHMISHPVTFAIWAEILVFTPMIPKANH